MAYYEKGAGEVTCVFSSGWAVPFPFSDMFEIADALSTKCRCIVFDRFGYGFSDDSTEKRDFPAITQETKALCDALQLSKTLVLVGHSLSTFHALDFAKRFPSMVKGIVLIDGYFFNGGIGRLLFYFNWVPAYCFLLLRKTGLLKKMDERTLKKALFGDRKIPNDIAKTAVAITRKRLFNKTVRRELTCAIRDLKRLKNGLEELKDIPVTAIARDVSYKSIRKLGEAMPDFTLVNVGKSSHFIHYEHNSFVVAQIERLCTIP